MKKTLILGSLLCALASAPAQATSMNPYPQGNDWSRQHKGDQYWEARRLQRDTERARPNEDNGQYDQSEGKRDHGMYDTNNPDRDHPSR